MSKRPGPLKTKKRSYQINLRSAVGVLRAWDSSLAVDDDLLEELWSVSSSDSVRVARYDDLYNGCLALVRRRRLETFERMRELGGWQ